MDILSNLQTFEDRFKKNELTLDEYIKSVQINVTDEEVTDGVSRLIYNHCMNKSDLRRLLGVSNTKLDPVLAELEADEIIAEPLEQGRAMLYDRFSVAEIVDRFNLPKYRDKFQPRVITVQNQKGGTGKSTSAYTLACKTALDVGGVNAQICVLDLDPQGSNLQYANPIEDDDVVLTIVDVLIRDMVPREESRFYQYQDSQFMSDEDLILEAACGTHLPNLSIYVAYPNDEIYSDIFHSLDDEEVQSKMLRELRDFVIPVLQKRFDIIIIDTPPQDSPITWATTMAADILLMPVTPHRLDFSSTKNYVTYLRKRIEKNKEMGDKLKLMKVVVVNKDLQSIHDQKIHDELMGIFQTSIMSNCVAHSQLFLSASSLKRSIYDIQKTEAKIRELATPNEYEKAVSSFNAFYTEFMNHVRSVSAKR